MGVTAKNFPASPFVGQIWETLVFAELRKQNQTRDNPSVFWYYRGQAAREIEFIIEKGGNLSFLECKWTENPDIHDAKPIMAVHSELLKKDMVYRPGRHFIISSTINDFQICPETDALGLESLNKVLS